MPLIDRLTRLFRADLHAVVDRLEEPEVLLRQALREMDDELAQSAVRLKAAGAEVEQLRERTADVERSLAGIGSELDLCFAAGNDALIRVLLRRRLEGERLLHLLRQRAAAGARRIEEDSARLSERQRACEALRRRADLVAAGLPGCASGPEQGFENCAISEADIDLALLRECEQRRAS